MNQKIAILLATYNGEKYLTQQLESLLNQTYQNWILYIYDDGSTDLTLSIIDRYSAEYPQIIKLNDSEKRKGACNGFLWMLNNVDSEYYMFCDQDDVWLENKVERTLIEMLKIENTTTTSTPVIVHTDLAVVDENLQMISHSHIRFVNCIGLIGHEECYPVNNVVTGCTMLFNKKAKQVMPKPYSLTLMHDSWIMLGVLVNGGKVSFLDEQLILYRQHGKNTLGASKYDNSLIYRIKNLRRSLYYNYVIFRNANKILNYSLFKYLNYKAKCLKIMTSEN